MSTLIEAPANPKATLWAGRILTGLVAALMTLDGAMKLSPGEEVRKACAELGIAESVVPGIGLALLASVALYAIPWTTVLGAILMTGYLGGAVFAHVRTGEQVPQMAFALIFGVLVWLGPFLREPRLRALVPLRRI